MALENWPCCAICTLQKGRPVAVRAYGIQHEPPTAIYVWTRCTHHGTPRVQEHKLMKGSENARYFLKGQMRMIVHTAP